MNEQCIDVVIPTYDTKQSFLDEAIRSVAKQTILRQGWKINVLQVDDGSRIYLYPGPLFQADVWVTLLSQEHAGVAAARNRGAAFPPGRGFSKYLAFLDSDDVWEPTKLERSIEAIGNNVLCICTSGIFFGSRERVIAAEPFTFQDLVAKDQILTSPVMTRDAFDAVGGFDESLVHGEEDIDFAFRALRAGVEYVAVPEPLVFYRKHDGAVTVRYRSEHQRATKMVRTEWAKTREVR